MLGNLILIAPFVAMFWAIWYQNFSAWVTQAERMDLHFMGLNWLAGQIQTANAVLILVFLPLFSYVIYPALEKIFPLTPLRKIGLGLLVTVVAFLFPAWIEARLGQGVKVNIVWQLVAYVFLTAAEIMVSVTHLEFCYTQAPKRLKSLVMATYLGAISLGNLFTAGVNYFIQNKDGSVKLSGANYYLFFAGLMLVTTAVFVFVAKAYRGKTYIQDESPAAG
ncbi:MAG: hypothetical protein HY043_16470 [Verrucomicrobia bacterium]|nr:hypothetical protein [Verrucomicrobiota bacterium]